MSDAMDAINKLCKWRTVLAGWHAGTRSLHEDGVPAMRDLMDKWLIARCEGSAIAALLIEKGVFTPAEFAAQMHAEAAHLDALLEAKFLGFRTTEDGVTIYDVGLAGETMRRLRFPP